MSNQKSKVNIGKLEKINENTLINRDVYLFVLITFAIGFLFKIIDFWKINSIYFWLCFIFILSLLIYVSCRMAGYYLMYVRDKELIQKIKNRQASQNVKENSIFKQSWDMFRTKNSWLRNWRKIKMKNLHKEAGLVIVGSFIAIGFTIKFIQSIVY